MTTIPDLLPAYRDYLNHERRMARNTVLSYTHDLERLHAHISKPVAEYVLNDLRDYQRKLSRDNMSVSTIQRHFAGFMTFWRWLRMEGHVTEVLPERIILPRKDSRVPRWLDAQELRKLLTTPVQANTPDLALRESTAWRLLAWSGIRRSELQALKVSSIRFSSGVFVVWSPKVRKERVLPLPDPMRAALTALTVHRGGDEPLFLGIEGGRWSFESMNAAFLRHLRTCGLNNSGITMHSLRHTYATMLVEHGASVFEVKELLGHADIKSTMKYIHADPKIRARALATTFLDGIDRAGGITEEGI